MAGRKRKPDHLKVVGGTQRPDRMNADAPTPSVEIPTAPEWLSKRATEIFDQLGAILFGMGLSSQSDVNMLAILASRLEEVEICTVLIEDGGRTFVSKTKFDGQGRVLEQQIKGHPAVAQRSEAMRHAQSLMTEFGLSPAARAKVSATKKTDENPFKDFA